MTRTVLEDLLRHARARVARRPDVPEVAQPRPSFRAAIAGKHKTAVIAEVKRQSPSAGRLGEVRDVVAHVQRYAAAGAAAISVLTEDSAFGGSFDDLRRAAIALPATPLLMKDFVVDPAQVEFARRLGASAVLLIARCLPGHALDELVAACQVHGLTALVECHTADELARALAFADVVIGVNNRDLDTLIIDRDRASRLLPAVPPSRVVVAESGYDTPASVRALKGVADAVLVGSALMRAADPATFLREVHR